jgi:luciferase family oxidoreductase group 1
MKLSILDQLPIRQGGKPEEPINEAIELAKLAEEWGYHRYWTAQFHATDNFTSAAPELVACRLASETSRMRIGSGGILLSGFSPYVVAEQFRMLEVMFPGRIDLGVGRTTGANDETFNQVLYGSSRGQDFFPEKVHDLTQFLASDFPEDEQIKNIKARPVVDSPPAVWLLGSGGDSARVAASQGLALSFAHFINPFDYADVLATYRDSFVPSSLYRKPEASLAVYVVCCDTEEEAIRQRGSRDLWWLEVFQGMDPPYRPLSAIEERGGFTPEEEARLDTKRDAVVLGTPEQVRDQLQELTEKAGVDELVIQTMLWDFSQRKKSFEMVAKALL